MASASALLTQPTPQERHRVSNNWGCDVTIAIAAITSTGQIVTVSDARISHGDFIPAADDATMKNRRISKSWGMMFAASDATAFIPVSSSVYATLGWTGAPNDRNSSEKQVRDAVQTAYENEFNERFFREHLSRWGYKDVADFRKNAFADMGKDLYGDYAIELAKFDLGLELLVYGFDGGTAHLFEVANPGKAISHNLRGFVAIGSGSILALAALNRKAVPSQLPEVVYRLLDAKFASETARDVGKKTYVITMSSDGKFGIMSQPNVEEVRKVWEKAQKQPEPQEALDVIENSQAVKAITRDVI